MYSRPRARTVKEFRELVELYGGNVACAIWEREFEGREEETMFVKVTGTNGDVWIAIAQIETVRGLFSYVNGCRIETVAGEEIETDKSPGDMVAAIETASIEYATKVIAASSEVAREAVRKIIDEEESR